MTITTADIQLYELLKQKLGTQQTEALVGYVDAKLKESHDHNLKTLVTKEDLKDLKLELKQDIADVRLEVVKTKTDIVRWVFALFIPLMLAIIGLYIKR